MTDALIHRLRSYSEAYPLDMFPELTKEEREMLRREHPGLLDRISASMGRHCGKIMDQAADAIERIPEQQGDWLRDLERWLSGDQWGTIRYMEGSQVYADIRRHLMAVRSALGDRK